MRTKTNWVISAAFLATRSSYSHSQNEDRSFSFISNNPLSSIEKYQTMLGESLYDIPTKDLVSFLDNEKNHGPLHYNNVTWISAHNAHANKFAAGNDIV